MGIPQDYQLKMPCRVRPNAWPLSLACLDSFVGVVATAIIAVLLSARHSESDPPARVQASNLGWTPELRSFGLPSPQASDPLPLPLRLVYSSLLDQALVVRDTDIENMGSIESSEPIMKIKRLFKANEVYEVRRYSDF